MAFTLGERLGDIDRVNQLAQAAKMISAFQRVNPADQRHAPKKDPRKNEDQADKLDLSQGEPEKSPDEAEFVEIQLEEEEETEHLDIAV